MVVAPPTPNDPQRGKNNSGRGSGGREMDCKEEGGGKEDGLRKIKRD